MVIVQLQLGHPHLGITTYVYSQRIDTAEIIDTVHRRAAPVIPAASAELLTSRCSPGAAR